MKERRGVLKHNKANGPIVENLKVAWIAIDTYRMHTFRGGRSLVLLGISYIKNLVRYARGDKDLSFYMRNLPRLRASISDNTPIYFLIFRLQAAVGGDRIFG